MGRWVLNVRMNAILQGYDVNEPTWFYLSLLLSLAVFFKFNRVWSVRNLDLLLLLSVTPGLLLVRNGITALGYSWLLATTGLLLLRNLFDGAFTRRPRLEQNLNAAGMVFLCVSALLFQIANVFTHEPHQSAVASVRKADDLLKRQDPSQKTGTEGVEVSAPDSASILQPGPTSALLAASVVPLTGGVELVAARAISVLAHCAVIAGLFFVGRWHFSDSRLGLAMATLYLLLPCTAYDVGRVNHVLPGALIVWAVAVQRFPILAGALLGLACGSMFFAFFLLPIWIAFYWNRGALKFTGALAGVAVLLLGCLLLTSADSHSLTRQIIGSIDWTVLKFDSGEGNGFWSLYDEAYRIPVIATFAVLLVALSVWPLQKNLEHLLAHSTAIIVATQFWYPHEGGVYVLWYLPLMLLVVFRPRLAHLPAGSNPDIPLAERAVPLGRDTLDGGRLRTQVLR